MSEPLSSPRNPRVAAARSLLEPRGRLAAGAFLVEGPHAVAAALASVRHSVTDLFVTPAAAQRDRALLRTAAAGGVPVTAVTDRVVRSLTDTVTPQGVVAVVRQQAVPLDDALGTSLRLAAVLAGIADPGNAGTVIRTADAAGADAVLFVGETVDPFSPKVVRATAGSLFHVPVTRHPEPLAALDRLRAAGARVYATLPTADEDLDQLLDEGALAGPVAWLFGNEAHGLPPEVAAAADRRVRIPVYGRAESLNLAAAAAVCLYATARAQRRPR